MRIAIFSTCVGDAMFPAAPKATTKLLERLGHEVVFPKGQACCGQMQVNSGYLKDALPIIENHVKTFSPVLDGEWDAIVVPSGSCTGAIQHNQAMVARHFGETALANRAEIIGEHTWDLPVLLTDFLGVTDVGAYFPHRVTYHPSCHSMRIAKVGDRPIRLLEQVEGIDLVPLPDAKVCCGFGGTFSLKYPDISTAMVTEKVGNVEKTGAEVLVADDYTCLMNIWGRMAKMGLNTKVAHISQVLASTREDPWVNTVGEPLEGAQTVGVSRDL